MPYPSFQSSPLLLHHPPALANNNANAFQMPSTPSRSASPAFASAAGPPSSSSHQIPFNATPVHHAPSPLGFGFGFGSSFGNNNQSVQPQPSFATSALANSFASPSHSTLQSPRRGDSKRRRDFDDDDDDDGEADEDMEQGSGQPSMSPRMRGSPGTTEAAKRSLVSKRIRAGIPHGGSPFAQQAASTHRSAWDSSAYSSTTAERNHSIPGKGRMSGLDVDLGKMLASVDKASLLSMLMNLLARSKDPSLGAQMLALLPTPSLESVEAALDEAEKNVRAAIPFVMPGGGAGVRDEYTWSRVRGPLAAFSDAALSYLPFFVTELDAKRDGNRDGSGGVDVTTREEVHPATTFTFLHALTIRVLRLHALLPPIPKSSLSFNAMRTDRASTSFGFGFGSSCVAGSQAATAPRNNGAHPTTNDKHANLADRIPAIYTSPVSPDALLSTLMPALLKQWTVLVERLDRAVNIEGRMFGQEVVLGWARALDTVNSQGQPDAQSAANPSPFSSLGAIQQHERRPPKPEEEVIREAMDEVHNRLERDLGWLVGGHGPAVQRTAAPAIRAGIGHAAHSHAVDGRPSQPSAPSSVACTVKRSRGSSMDDEEEEL
ncbi:hypothetical protein ACQY0O_004319 [Thecaphora frezii]